VVENKHALPALINGLIEALGNGEIDALITPTEEKRTMPQKKAA